MNNNNNESRQVKMTGSIYQAAKRYVATEDEHTKHVIPASVNPYGASHDPVTVEVYADGDVLVEDPDGDVIALTREQAARLREILPAPAVRNRLRDWWFRFGGVLRDGLLILMLLALVALSGCGVQPPATPPGYSDTLVVEDDTPGAEHFASAASAVCEAGGPCVTVRLGWRCVRGWGCARRDRLPPTIAAGVTYPAAGLIEIQAAPLSAPLCPDADARMRVVVWHEFGHYVGLPHGHGFMAVGSQVCSVDATAWRGIWRQQWRRGDR